MPNIPKITKTDIGYLVLLAIMILGVMMIWNSSEMINAQIAEADEIARPAEIELIILNAPECKDCFDHEGILSVVASEDIKITNQRMLSYDSDEGKELIEKYEITSVPTIIFTGELDKQNVQDFLSKYTTEKSDAAIWSTATPVYVNTQTDEIIGRVTMTFLTDASCKECYDPLVHKTILVNQFGLNIKNEESFDVNSSNGKELIAKYDIKSVPTVILSPEAGAYQIIKSVWPTIGSQEEDGSFIFRDLSAMGDIIYKDLETGKTIEPIKE